MATIENFLLKFKVEGQEAIKRASDSIKNLSDEVSQFGANTGPLGNAISGLTGKLGPLGMAAGAVGGAMAALGLRAIQLSAEISDVAGSTGIAEGTLFNLRQSIIAAGGSSQDFAGIAGKLNQSVQEAASGNETLQQSFKNLGVFVTDAGGNVRSTEEILRDIIDRFQDGEISAGEYSAAIKILGDQVKKLDLTQLNALADPFKDEEIRQLDAYAAQFDVVMSQIESRLVTATAKLFNYLDLNRRLMTDTQLAAQGLKRIPQTFWSGEKIVEMTPDEIAARDANVNEINRLRNRAAAARPAQTGGYGDPNAERLKREAEQRAKEAQRAGEKAAREQQRLAEQRQKTVLNGLAEEQRQREETNQDWAEYQRQIDAATVSAWRQIDAYDRMQQLASERLDFEQSLTGLTRDQADLARKIFDARADEADQLRQLSQIENLSADERAKREQQIRDIANRNVDDINRRAAAARAAQQDFVAGWKSAFAQYAEDAANSAQQAEDIFQTMSKGFEDAWVDFVRTGKLSFKDLANSVIADLARIEAKKLFVNLVTSIGGLFGRAGGGGVNEMQPYMVGETGPELFIPNAAGRIVPNYALTGSGGGTSVYYNISAVDAMSFKQLVASDPSFIYAVTEQGRRSLPQTRR